MAGVTQTIDTYYAGISQQPDLKKFPGQLKDIVNAIPDITEGLYKRPGSQRIGTTPLSGVYTDVTHGTNKYGAWFHYYRDETEGSYIGQVHLDGTLKVWRCSDGVLMGTVYDGGETTALKAYLATTNPENLQFLTINDTTYITNRDISNANTLVSSQFSGTYLQSGTTATISAQNHDVAIGDWVYIDFDGAASVDDGTYKVTGVATLNYNNTTIVVELPNSRTVNSALNCTVQPRSPKREHDHFAYIDLLRSENGRQYALNLYSNENVYTIKRATRVKIKSDTLVETGGSAHCPGIGTQVFSATAAGSYSGTNIVSIKNSSGSNLTSDRENLIFRITAIGQQGQVGSWDDEGVSIHTAFACTYNRQIVLLHGGEGWNVGDEVTVTLDQAQDNFNYTVVVEEIEEVQVKSNIKAVRPTPTPFDADTAVTVDTIVGGIISELSGTSISYTVIGSGIYLYSSSAFSVEVTDRDLMRVMQSEVNDVSELPIQCKDGYILKVSNSDSSDADDYYLKFAGENGTDGPGAWSECAKPDIATGLYNMPVMLRRTATSTFTLSRINYQKREIGDTVTNGYPSFLGQRINKVLFYRNRIAFLSGSSVILSRPGELLEPSFWAKTALAVSAIDPIDISSSSTFPSDLFDGSETTTGLAVFSTNQQFLLASDAEIMNPDTANLRSISTYNYNKDVPPLNMGTTIGFIDDSGKYSRFNEMANIQREGEPTVIEQSKLVPTLLPKDIDLLTNSRENSLVLYGKTNSDTVYGYKYFNAAEKREQAAWFKMKLNNPIKYHFIIDDDYYFLDTDNFLQKISLMQQDTDPSIDENSVNYLIHLDNWTTVGNGSYSTTTKLTTFANQSDWIDQVTSPNGALVLVDIDDDSKRVGRYAQCTVTNTDDFTVPGNWDYTEKWDIIDQYYSNQIQLGADTILPILTGNAAHGLSTGDPIRYSVSSGGSTIGGLSNTTTYYAIVVAANTFRLATSESNANNGTYVNLTSNGSGTHTFFKLIPKLYIGYLYEYSVHFPTFYLNQVQGAQSRSHVNASLTLHRLKFNFGKSGLYTTTLKRVGKTDYVETYESTFADDYLVSDAPYVPDQVQTVPIYENTNNVDVHLTSSHPAPATLHALSWEGDYSPRNYKRV